MRKFLNIKLCVLLALFGLMLAACDSDMYEDKMKLTMSTTVSGKPIAKTTKFSSGAGDIEWILGDLYSNTDPAAGTATLNKPNDTIELVCTTQSGVVTFRVKSDIDRPTSWWNNDLKDEYNDILIDALKEWVEYQQGLPTSADWIDKTENWSKDNDWWED